MAEISEQVKVLDGVVRYRFGDNAELIGAWASVQRGGAVPDSHGAGGWW